MSTENLDIKLIPWDPLSLAQFQRLRQQRLACGWGADRVELWQHQQLLNQKALYWIARFLPPAVKDQTSHKFQTLKPDPRSTQQQLIQAHTHRFPLEQDPLSDTAPTTTSPQRCRSKPFTPIGHVSLDLIPNTISPSIDPAKHRFGGSNFYISPALRGQFLARMAMEAMKQLAASAPYSARELVAEVPSRGTDAKFSLPDWYEMFGWKRVEGSTRYLIESDGSEVESVSTECDVRGYATRTGVAKTVL